MGDYLDQADFAGRIGKIAKIYQKDAETSNEEIYEATLHICLLHTLLTSCDEVLDRRETQKPPEVTASLPQQDTHWGLNTSMVETKFEGEPLHITSVVKHMRNAVSHPCPWKVLSQDWNTNTPSTGFYCSKTKDRQIAAFVFIDSRDVDSRGIKEYEDEREAKYVLGERIDTRTGRQYRRRFGFPRQTTSSRN